MKGILNYNDIIEFIMGNINDNSKTKFHNFKSIINYINEVKQKYNIS